MQESGLVQLQSSTFSSRWPAFVICVFVVVCCFLLLSLFVLLFVLLELN